jgi:hypothetical protein
MPPNLKQSSPIAAFAAALVKSGSTRVLAPMMGIILAFICFEVSNIIADEKL